MRLFLLFFLFLSSGFAYETDQYTVPPRPLKDIGPQLSAFIYQNLQSGIAEINTYLKELPTQIADLEKELGQYPQDFESPLWLDHPEKAMLIALKEKITKNKQLLEQLRTDFGVIAYLHNKYSLVITWNEQRDGVFGAPLDYVYLKSNEKYEDVYYSQGKLNTIYSFAGFHRIISPSYFVFASTVNIYGTYMGVDKFGHFINQGYEYFDLYQKIRKQGLSHQDSLLKIVQWGVDTEDGLFGKIVDGVYSNADLAANFSGFMFYQNFLQPIKIDQQIYPQIIKKNSDGIWFYNEAPVNSRDELLKRFVSDHFDESLNASIYESPQRFFVTKAIKSRCQNWKVFYKLKTEQDFQRRTRDLRSWYSYEYGQKSEGLVDIPSLCFL